MRPELAAERARLYLDRLPTRPVAPTDSDLTPLAGPLAWPEVPRPLRHG